jgi:hypothetical protein
MQPWSHYFGASDATHHGEWRVADKAMHVMAEM